MTEITNHIHQLMYTHECIMLPNLGGLVAQYNTVKYNSKTNCFSPENKFFVLNTKLAHDDGLLAEQIAKSSGLSYAESKLKLAEFTEHILREINLHGKFNLGRTGMFYKDEHNKFRFKGSSQNYSVEFFGLSEFYCEALSTSNIQFSESVQKEVKPADREETKVIPINSIPHKSRSKWWVAAAMIPFGFYLAWIPMKTNLLNEGDFHYSQLNPFTFNTPEKEYGKSDFIKLSLDSIEPISIEVINSFYDGDNKAIAETTAVEVTPLNTNDLDKGTSPSYHVIGGCFSSKENAESLVKNMTDLGYEAFILDKNKGLYRVSVATHYSKKEAKLLLGDFKSSTSISGWILKK